MSPQHLHINWSLQNLQNQTQILISHTIGGKTLYFTYSSEGQISWLSSITINVEVHFDYGVPWREICHSGFPSRRSPPTRAVNLLQNRFPKDQQAVRWDALRKGGWGCSLRSISLRKQSLSPLINSHYIISCSKPSEVLQKENKPSISQFELTMESLPHTFIFLYHLIPYLWTTAIRNTFFQNLLNYKKKEREVEQWREKRTYNLWILLLTGFACVTKATRIYGFLSFSRKWESLKYIGPF